MLSLRDNPPAPLLERFRRLCAEPSDINEHLGILWGLARQCDNVMEFGVRSGVSLTALLAAQPSRLTCVDTEWCPVVHELEAMCGRTELFFFQGDSRSVSIVGVDLLHIDTIHAYSCLSVELRMHSPYVHKWIALHDTAIFGQRGDDGGEGMQKAIDELVVGGKWRTWAAWPHSYGMTVLQRIAPG